MSNSNEKIYFPLNGEKKEALSLEKDRIYNIPDFQRTANIMDSPPKKQVMLRTGSDGM